MSEMSGNLLPSPLSDKKIEEIITEVLRHCSACVDTTAETIESWQVNSKVWTVHN